MTITAKILNGSDILEISRDIYLDRMIIRKQNGFIKVITGIRRCGKSYLMNTIFYNYLLSENIDPDHIIKFAFDSADDLMLIDEDIIEISEQNRKVDPKKFMKYLSAKIKDNDLYYILLDEVQLLGSFETVLNGYLRKDNLDIYVTGSNSKFLSSDIITEFKGRGDEIHIMPLSFSEFYSAYDGTKEEAYDDYVVYGGLPAVALMKTDEQKANYLITQMKKVYIDDIVNRNNLNSNQEISELVDILASGISSLTNPRKLENTFKSVKNATLCASTIDKYISYLRDSFLISKAERYDVKGKKYISTPYKLYFEDIGLRNARLNFRQIEETHLMENIIYNELRYRGYNVDVGVVEFREKTEEGKEVRKQVEIDFVANQGNKRYYIQSAYSIPDEEKWQQETRPFDKTNDSFKKIVIVEKSMKPRRDDKGYLMIGVKEFLLDSMSLEI